jgi:hypothetical protein
MAQGTIFTGAYNSFSGVDIKAVFNNVIIGELQAISYSITREKAPIYTMGSADPRSFSRGKRGIAGTLIFIMFDRHAMLGALGFLASPATAGTLPKFMADMDDLRPAFSQNLGQISDTTQTLSAPSGRTIGATVQEQESPLSDVGSDQQAALPWYADQILPFDITLAAANEYGASAVMRIYGCEILNEGFGTSVDDIQSAQQSTYVAKAVMPWTNLPSRIGELNINPST